MRDIDSLETIVTHGLCIGCGLCESLAGSESVEMGVTSYGQMRPHVKEALDEPVIEQIRVVCPGIAVTGPIRPRLARMV